MSDSSLPPGEWRSIKDDQAGSPKVLQSGMEFSISPRFWLVGQVLPTLLSSPSNASQRAENIVRRAIEIADEVLKQIDPMP
jgi:hypothetical protein